MTKIGVTRRSFRAAKCSKICLQRSPRPPSWQKEGLFLRARKGKWRKAFRQANTTTPLSIITWKLQTNNYGVINFLFYKFTWLRYQRL